VSEIKITYFSDVLCVWAYVGQARIEAVKEKFGKSVRIEHRFCSVFGDTAAKIASTWKDRGCIKDSVRICSISRSGFPTSRCTRKSG
jgi:predicted DsbA family dithiol-disulfide isomerase